MLVSDLIWDVELWNGTIYSGHVSLKMERVVDEKMFSLRCILGAFNAEGEISIDHDSCAVKD